MLVANGIVVVAIGETNWIAGGENGSGLGGPLVVLTNGMVVVATWRV